MLHRIPRCLSSIALIASFAAAGADTAHGAPAPRVAADGEGPMTAPAARAAIAGAATPATLGYYRMPAIHGDTIVFVSEGDLWRTGTAGGQATRLTTHAGEELSPSISPDGKTLAFTAAYEGPRSVYTMPLEGGLPTRRSWSAGRVGATGWTPDGKLLYATDASAALPSVRTWRVDLATNASELLPLAQCSDAAFIDQNAMVFTRLHMQGSHTDRYKGGTAQNLWGFTLPTPGPAGDAKAVAEAKPLTADYAGTSRRPLVHHGAGGARIVFTTDRSGRMNLWSMKPDGSDLKQLTKHTELDIGGASIDGDRIVYQLGPDLRIYDVAKGTDQALAINLASDFDQTRERWVKDPIGERSAVHLSPNGDRVVATTRGHVFVVPVKQGRTLEADHRQGIRYREADFMPDGKTLVAISDESGELELATLPANGVGAPKRLTTDGATVRWRAVPSPDGKLIAHTDKLLRLWVLDVEKGTSTLVEENTIDQPEAMVWAPDSKWLAYAAPAQNMNRRVRIWSAEGGPVLDATTDRYDSYTPAWSPDGKFLYFLSDRVFESVVKSPWGYGAPDPYFDKTGNIYQLTLKAGTRSPFLPNDEVQAVLKAAEKKAEEKKKEEEKKAAEAKAAEAKAADAKSADAKPGDKPPVRVEIDAAGLATRLERVPGPAYNFGRPVLFVTDKALFFMTYEATQRTDADDDDKPTHGTLFSLTITNENSERKPVLTGVNDAQLSGDRSKMLLRRGAKCFVVEAVPGPAAVDKPGVAVDFSAVALSVSPREEWRQVTIDAWRMLRDYFYDRKMHGVKWRAVLDKYLPAVERARSREEVSDVLAEMTGELSALHHFVRGGDLRTGSDMIAPATLGADLVRDDAAGGWRVAAIPVSDPDEIGVGARSPLEAPEVSVKVGDVIVAIDGVPTLSVPDPALLLRTRAGRQTLLSVLPAGSKEPRDVIVRPLSPGADAELRYRSWELARRKRVEEASGGDFAYTHLRAMGTEDVGSFARDYYPAFNRKGLIVDVRNNRGGNIDSWILNRLIRKPWMYWSQPAGRSPAWNMQYAFHGPMVVLCNETTGSDGEAFTEGFKRLGLGKVIGTRTWGGEIWLSQSNTLVDDGIASAGENGVFDAKGVWLIEGHGVEPDMVVDNLPHATFMGEDAQLQAALDFLKQRLKEQPVVIPAVPPTPDKSK